MRKGLITTLCALAIAAIVSTAYGAVITGTQTYGILDAGTTATGGNGLGTDVDVSSGSTQTLFYEGNPIATIDVGNNQNLVVVPNSNHPADIITYGVAQTGETALLIQGDANGFDSIDFASEQSSSMAFSSEGSYFAFSGMGGDAEANIDCENCDQHVTILDHNCAYAGALAGEESELNYGTFGYDAVSEANLLFDDGCPDEMDLASGIAVSSYGMTNLIDDCEGEGCDTPDHACLMTGVLGWQKMTADVVPLPT